MRLSRKITSVLMVLALGFLMGSEVNCFGRARGGVDVDDKIVLPN